MSNWKRDLDDIVLQATRNIFAEEKPGTDFYVESVDGGRDRSSAAWAGRQRSDRWSAAAKVKNGVKWLELEAFLHRLSFLAGV
jgi:hypothetical protein